MFPKMQYGCEYLILENGEVTCDKVGGICDCLQCMVKGTYCDCEYY